uniref:1-phosphatidylinositol 4,5-bisphosphate phosphodiesterase gamma-1-like n=1 Tax=Callorhinchus milii TaxID=7868 RepID=A0A4W3GK07_CALMI
MQLNQTIFSMNGKCGIVLQPEIMRDENFDPFDKNSLRGLEPITVQLQILGARHLPKNGRSIRFAPSWRWRCAEPSTTTA